jgi:L,D-transpeptidase-like protein
LKSNPGGSAPAWRVRRGFLATAAALSFLLLVACEKPPVAILAAARTAVERARRAEAGRYAAEELKQAEQDLRLAQRNEVMESSRLAFRRDYRAAISLAEQSRFMALRALKLAGDRRQKTQGDTVSELAALRELLDRSREIKRFVAPKDPQVSRLLVGAAVDLEVADIRMKKKDYPAALEAAQSGTRRIRQAEQLLLSSMVRYTSHPDIPSWRKWVDEAVRRSRSGGVSFVVDKLRRRLTVYRGGRKAGTYTVDIGLGGMERKLRAGDDATPEGLYRIQEIRGPGQTRYYRAFLLDYPNDQDRRRFEQARRQGWIPKGADPGGLIEIHGEGGRDQDWTKGCVALTNPEMNQLARLVRIGTPVAIVGYNPRDSEDSW